MSKNKKRIAVFTGTRAEYGLLYWVMKDISADKDLTLQLIASGAHLSPEFGLTYKKIIDDGFHIDEKVENIVSSDSSVGIAKSLGLATLGYAESFSRLDPDMIIILGDRYEALAAAQTAMILKIPILHIHGGEITEGAYDDSIRHAITKMSTLHATSNEIHKNRVIQLGETPNYVFNVGALGLDYIKRGEFLSRSETHNELGIEQGDKFILMTYHPVTLSNENPIDSYKEILSAFKEYPEFQKIITFPNADEGGRKIIEFIQEFVSNNSSEFKIFKSLGQKTYLSALKYCSLVLGNSSSGIIEAPSFGVPTVNIGLRQKGRTTADSVIHTKVKKSEIIKGIDEAFLRGSFKGIKNPYYKNDVSGRIIKLIKSQQLTMVKKFHNLEF